MSRKRYLLYLDILGFEALAQEIAKKSKFEEDWIRQTLISEPVSARVKELGEKAVKVSPDSYLLTVDSVQRAFEVVGELTTIEIPHKCYGFVPLELCLDAREIDEAIKLEPQSRQVIIKALRNDVFRPYHKYCSTKKGIRITETFVLFTPEFFNDLELLDRKYCEAISYEGKSFLVANLEKIRQRAQVFQFLKEIECEGDKRYERIDEVYVPPLEYEGLANTLKGKRLLFITGTGEYGKTYTAVRLMWEYYRRGYEPRWIKGGEPPERIDVRRRLENITAELKRQSIIYFEDPFGKTKYERRETLEREIGPIISTVGRVEDVYVIITSREEVFKDFKKEKLSSRELEEFQRTLNIKNASYDYGKRREMLRKWAEEKDCEWLKNNELKELLLGLMRDERVFPTPLSIRAFAADSAGIKEEAKLIEEMERKSDETARAFATEIRGMSDDKILFLSFLFISDSFEVSFVRGTYQELVRERNLKDAWEFHRVLGWFKDDKISIIQGRIQFSHSSYSEALKYLLVEDGYATRLNEQIFSRSLFKLSEKAEAAWAVAQAVAENFDELPEEVRNKLLFKLSEKAEAASDVAWPVALAVARHFYSVPEEVRSKLIFKLSEKDEAAWAVARAGPFYFGKLPKEVTDLIDELQEPS